MPALMGGIVRGAPALLHAACFAAIYCSSSLLFSMGQPLARIASYARRGCRCCHWATSIRHAGRFHTARFSPLIDVIGAHDLSQGFYLPQDSFLLPFRPELHHRVTKTLHSNFPAIPGDVYFDHFVLSPRIYHSASSRLRARLIRGLQEP